MSHLVELSLGRYRIVTVAQSVINSNTWPDVYGYGEHMLGTIIAYNSKKNDKSYPLIGVAPHMGSRAR